MDYGKFAKALDKKWGENRGRVDRDTDRSLQSTKDDNANGLTGVLNQAHFRMVKYLTYAR